jgi:hypothetical protein
MDKSVLWLLCISICAIGLIPPSAASADQSRRQLRQDSPDPVSESGTSRDRLFWTIPDFLTAENFAGAFALVQGKIQIGIPDVV